MADWMKSYEGLQAQWQASHWDKSKVDWKELVKLSTHRTDTIWERSCQLARDTMPSCEAECIETAERLCIDQCIIPPHWRTEIYCDECGIIFTRNEEVGCLVCKFEKEINNVIRDFKDGANQAVSSSQEHQETGGIPALHRDDSSSSSSTGRGLNRMGFLPSMGKRNESGGK